MHQFKSGNPILKNTIREDWEFLPTQVDCDREL